MSFPAYPGTPRREDPDLSPRQRAVFAALVTLHGHAARPIGSEAIGQESGLPLSSATIRSELSELEELGLLGRAHTSAGRVPTARGYEFFVRHLVTPVPLPAALAEEVDESLRRSVQDVERLLQEASRLIASLTHQLGLAVADTLEGERLVRLDLVPLEGPRALMVLNVGETLARTLALELESPLEPGELEEVAGVLRARLLDRTLEEVRDRLEHDPELVRDSAVRLVARAARESWTLARSTPLLSHGLGHIAEQPEFASAPRLGSLLHSVESGSPLDRIMFGNIEGLVTVRVGLDEDRALAGCSLVSYVLPGAVPGAVGLLGPLRMDYARALGVVDFVGMRVSELLQS
jgi:heat-inducible transcriptional repressor